MLVLNEHSTKYRFEQVYLKGKRVVSDKLMSTECEFCHIEHASEMIVRDIKERAYPIIEMENCD